MADGFHIDSSGNLWIGSTSTSFDSSAPFYVETDGTIQASSGTIGGLNLGSDFIASTNFNNTNETGYRLQSDGNAQFYGTLTATDLNATGATISGTITASDGTIGGIDINTSDIQSSNYSSATAGFKIDSSGGAEFNGPILSFGKATGTPSAAGTTSIKLGDAILFSRDEGTTGNHLFSTKPFVVMADGSEDNPSLTIQGDYEKMGFFLETNNDFNQDTFKASNGDDDIFSFNSDSTAFAVLGTLVLSSAIQVGGSTGTSGQVLSSTGNGLSWANTSGHSHSGYSFPNSGTLLSSNTHSHGTPLTSNHENAANPHDNYLQEADHNANNTAHSNFITSADLSTHITNNNNLYNSVVDHTDITANQGGGSAHGLSLSGVNAAVLHVNDNSLHTNHNHNYGLAEDPHDNNEHNADYITNNNANAHHGNTYANAGHGHAYANSNHNHSYASSNHNHDYAANSHNHAYASAFHNHNNFASNTHGHNAYALSGHGHGSNSPTPNMWMHDDRFLNINANTVPGLNVVNRLNPVTANFTSGYVQGLKDNADPEIPDSFTSMDRKTYRLTVQDVEQALTDDGVDTSDVAWLIDRLYYADRYLTEETSAKQAHGARGLLNGELEAVLVQAVKDLSAKIDTLEDRIATLEG
tara:strand:+ start:1994 stop:3913 length:1920 start_codon:yes stop_codon:yes gene_type:complete